MIIAIDGPAASGKGTLGKRIAAHYNLIHLDTGKLYRAVARDTLAAGASPAEQGAARAAAEALDVGTLSDPFLMDGRLGEAASIVASHPAVREVLLAYQRAFARRFAIHETSVSRWIAGTHAVPRWVPLVLAQMRQENISDG